ncbi:hypothetical protein GOBAR_DD07883 [Gossypium barbadense]|nr:hypothetical protein GOBAR_DD07883 [Gossypium barbadense]
MAKEKVYEELGEVKVENEKLREDFISKAELCEHLKKVQNEQVKKIREASSKIEKLAQELLEKEEEITTVKRSNEELKCILNEKESAVKHLNVVNEKLRAERDERNRKSEQENRRLVLALDEANEKKCLEAEKAAKNPRVLREREDLLIKVEEEKSKVEDQLKWKKEQFKHLEEAHEKLRDRFKASKKEWEQEKSALLDEISSLQTRLDSEIRVTRDLQNRLQVCNQALSREETRRKHLEVEVLEFKTHYENIFSECQDAKSQLDCLNSQRDNEVATLRHVLGTKESFYKEMEYRSGKLEQENQELLTSLKELREARIQEAGSSSSLSKLKNKLRSVEQMHKDCSTNLRAKEAEWNSQREEMTRKLNDYSSQLQSKDAALKVLEMELEGCLSSAVQLKLQNEEISVMLLVLKSGMSEARLKLANVEAELGLHEKERIEELSILKQQLEMKDTALADAQKDIADERERTAILSRRVDTLDQLEDKHQLMEKELNRCKEMLEESSRCQLWLKEQALQVENDSKEKIREVYDALDALNSELEEERENVASLLRRVESLDLIEGQRLLLQKELEKCKEMLEEAAKSQIQFKEQALQMENESREKLREVCDALETTKSELTEEQERTASLTIRVEFLDQIEERWLQTQAELKRYKEMLEEACRRQCQLEEQSVHMKNELGEKLKEVSDALETENIELAEEREKTASLMKRIESSDQLEEQLALKQKELDRYNELLESSRCQLLLEEQISRTDSDSERELKEVRNALVKANSELSEKTREGHELELELWIWESIAERLKAELEESQALRKELEASLLAQMDVEESIKKEKEDLVRITEEKDGRIVNLQQQMVSLVQEHTVRELEEAANSAEDSVHQQTREHEAELEAKHMEKALDELGLKTTPSDWISEFAGEDAKLMGILGRIVQSFDNCISDMKGNDELYDTLKENKKSLISSPAARKPDSLVEERSPFRELN